LRRVARRAPAPLVQSNVEQFKLVGVQAPAFNELPDVTKFPLRDGEACAIPNDLAGIAQLELLAVRLERGARHA